MWATVGKKVRQCFLRKTPVKKLSLDQVQTLDSLGRGVWTAIADTYQYILRVCHDNSGNHRACCYAPPLCFTMTLPTRTEDWTPKHLESQEPGHNMETN